MKEKYTIRNLTEDEVSSVAVEWAAKKGWNPGLHAVPCVYATNPKGFFAGLIGNEPIASISAAAYDSTFAFLGFYIVRSEYRNRPKLLILNTIFTMYR